MTIECPNCGFSGRVPAHAVDIPHHARCPKCRFGFDIGNPAAAILEPPIRGASWEVPSSPAPSSSDSSYEIEAIGGGWDDDDVEEPSSRPAPKRRPISAAAPTADEPATPWRARLLEWCAVALLVWAALIGSRAVPATLVRGDELVFSQAMFWPVAAVVTLVAGAAGLLLALEPSRRLPRDAPAGTSAPLSIKRRGWGRARAKTGSN